MFAYALPPIDHWTGWKTEGEFLNDLNGDYLPLGESEYLATKERALILARDAGWEGDMREGPFIAGLPTHNTGDDREVLIGWKQDNNGTTFIVSPYRLSWLEAAGYMATAA